ncbi:hypothetical protein F4814DRAFT_400568 [Daldinia grandis]|nr:hypothetical protein F4814DRAFT_400568 [Daldinia grandis]
MVGVPKSNRCDFCKRRKTKCDEAWPTCGSCRKAGKECSGPSKRVKFIHGGRHVRQDEHENSRTGQNAVTSLTDEALDTGSDTSWLNLKNKTTTSGAIFSKMRIWSQKQRIPNKLSGTQADLLAGSLIKHLNTTEGTGYSLTVFLSTLKYVPPLLESSEALYDATNLLISTWLQLCRGANPHDVLSLISYNRALRSLQGALNDPQKQTSSATLAATIYLQMTEHLFDYSKGIDQISHCNGIYAIMMKRGAPKPGDDLGCQLILDSFSFMFRLLIRGDIENFFTQPEWENVLVSFFAHFKTRSPILVEISKVIHQSTVLAGVVRRFAEIRSVPKHLQDLQVLEALYIALSDVREKFRALNRNTVQPLLQSKAIYKEDDPSSPFSTSYTFPNGVTALHFTNVASFNIVTNTLKQELNAMLDIDDPSLEAECLEWSGWIWRSCRYILSLRPLCAASFSGHICVSYMSAGHSDRAYLLDVLKETDGYRQQPVSRWTESAVLAQYDSLLGR